jgi:hypothetical protein
MKNLSVILVLLMTVGLMNAQTTNEEIDYIQAIFGMEKRTAVKDFILLEDSESSAFWKLYDEYEICVVFKGQE